MENTMPPEHSPDRDGSEPRKHITNGLGIHGLPRRGGRFDQGIGLGRRNRHRLSASTG